MAFSFLSVQPHKQNKDIGDALFSIPLSEYFIERTVTDKYMSKAVFNNT